MASRDLSFDLLFSKDLEFSKSKRIANNLKIEQLFDAYRGSDGVIVANGPSLRISDLSNLGGGVSFGFNRIFLAFEETSWRPDYYCVSDQLVAQNNIEQIRSLQIPKIFSWNLETLFSDDESAIFISNGPSQPYSGLIPDVDELLDNTMWVPPAWNLLAGTKPGHSVVSFALKVGFWLGLERVFVTGLDHEFNIRSLRTRRRVFGNRVLVSGGEQNHFHPNYRLKGEEWTSPKLNSISADFDAANSVYRAAGRHVINASRKSAYRGWDTAPFEEIQKSKRLVEKGLSDTSVAKSQFSVTVVLAVYNEARFIETAIMSVLEQSLPPTELIIVDDCSTDGTLSICQLFADRFPGIVKVIQNKDNEGQGASFCRAFAIAKGNYIALIDGDDWWARDRLRHLRRLIESEPDAILFQQNLEKIEWSASGWESKGDFRKFLVSGDALEMMRIFSTLGRFVPTSGLSFSKALVPEVVPFLHNFRISADGYITRVAARVGRFASTTGCGAYYRIHNQNSTYGNPSYDASVHRDRLETYLTLNYRRGPLQFPAEVLRPYKKAQSTTHGLAHSLREERPRSGLKKIVLRQLERTHRGRKIKNLLRQALLAKRGVALYYLGRETFRSSS